MAIILCYKKKIEFNIYHRFVTEKKEDATCTSEFLVKHRIGNSFWPPGTLHTMDITAVRAFFY